VAEDAPGEVPPEVAEHAAATGAVAVAVSARLESELGELDEDEAAAMREDLGAAESGLGRVIRGAFELLRLISFFTAGSGKEARAHAISRGSTAWDAAGKVHTDIQRGFVRAEIVPWDALVEAGGYAGARDRGQLRLEGRDYAMTDGDVMTVKFTP
jgi:ribosome-binding ATPase YchF (GTP1/OBG family)